MRREGLWVRASRGFWEETEQVLCPQWLLLIFRNTPSVNYLVLFSFHVHTFTSWIKSFVWPCVSISALGNIITVINRWFEPVQNGSLPSPWGLPSHKLWTLLASVPCCKGLCVSRILGFGEWVSLGLKIWPECRTCQVSYRPPVG